LVHDDVIWQSSDVGADELGKIMSEERQIAPSAPLIVQGDDDSLAEFGYKQELPRVLGFWTTWALGFAFISPIVGLYTIFALATETVGPTWIWALVIVIVGQLFVALVYTQLAEKWPITGGIYQWARHALGKKYGWWAGWIYIWALTLTVAAVAYGGGEFLNQLIFGGEELFPAQKFVAALAVLVVMTFVTFISMNALKWVLYIGIFCSLAAMLPISLALLVLHREHSFSIFTDTSLIPEGSSFGPAFISAIAIAGWVLLGFDAVSSLAEETKKPRKVIPNAIVFSLAGVGLVDMIGAAALMLAAPNIPDMVAGKTGDPISSIISHTLGAGVADVFTGIVVVAFTACGVAVQATAVRVIFSFSRDNMFPFSRLLRRVDQHRKSPTTATLFTFFVCVVLMTYANALTLVVSFATAAYYVAFLAPVAAILILRMRRSWNHEGTWAMRRIGPAVTLLAFLWLIFELVNISWPRDQGLAAWQEWAVIIGFVICISTGLIYYKLARPYERTPID
jgi:amino acid transporter